MTAPRLGSVLQYLRGVARPPVSGAASDAGLLEQFLSQRDEAAFTALVARHGPMVLGVARNVLNDPHAAEDVFQATFLVLARNVQSLRQRSSLASWLYGVAYRVALNARGRAARQRKHERRVAAMGRTEPQIEAANADLRPLIVQELNRLPEKYRAPLVLCYLQGMTNEEAAEQLQWPAGTVKGRLARAREVLRGRLAQRGLALTTAGVNAALLENQVAAAVSPALLNAAVQAAAPVALEATALAALTGPAAELARQVVQQTLLSRIAGLTLAAAALLAGGAGAVWYASSTATPLIPFPDQPQAVAGPHLAASFPEAEHYRGMPEPLAISIDGKRVAVLARRDTEAPELHLQDVATGKVLASREIKPGLRAVGANGQAVAMIYGDDLGNDVRVEICDLAGLKVQHEWRDDQARVRPTECFLTGDALLLLGGHVEEAAPANNLPAAGAIIGGIGGGFNPFGGADQNAVVVYGLDGKQKPVVHALAAEDTLLAAQVVKPAGAPALVLLVERADGVRLALFDLTTGKSRTLADKVAASALAASADGRTLALQTAEQAIQLIDGGTGKPARTIGDGDTTIVCFAFSPDGRQLATAGSDRRITLWDVATGRVRGRFEQPRVQRVCFAADGRLLAAGSPEEVKTWALGR